MAKKELAAGYAGLGDDLEDDVATPVPGQGMPLSPSRNNLFHAGTDAAQQSLDELAKLLQSAYTQLRDPHLANPVEVARKMRDGMKTLTEVNIHRDKKKAAEFETIDYMPQDSEMYRKWLHTQPLQRIWDRWLMMFLVGIVVGLCAFSLHVCFNSLATWKVCARNNGPGFCGVPQALRFEATSSGLVPTACRTHTHTFATHTDERAALHHQQERRPRVALQRQLLSCPRCRLCWKRPLDLACGSRLRRPRGHGLPERVSHSEGACARCSCRRLASLLQLMLTHATDV